MFGAIFSLATAGIYLLILAAIGTVLAIVLAIGLIRALVILCINLYRKIELRLYIRKIAKEKREKQQAYLTNQQGGLR